MNQANGFHQVLDALKQFDTMAQQGAGPEDVAVEAEVIAAGWLADGRGGPDPEAAMRQVGELRRWCAVAASGHARSSDRLSRAGQPRDAARSRHRAAAFGHAWAALTPMTDTPA